MASSVTCSNSASFCDHMSDVTGHDSGRGGSFVSRTSDLVRKALGLCRRRPDGFCVLSEVLSIGVLALFPRCLLVHIHAG